MHLLTVQSQRFGEGKRFLRQPHLTILRPNKGSIGSISSSCFSLLPRNASLGHLVDEGIGGSGATRDVTRSSPQKCETKAQRGANSPCLTTSTKATWLKFLLPLGHKLRRLRSRRASAQDHHRPRLLQQLLLSAGGQLAELLPEQLFGDRILQLAKATGDAIAKPLHDC